MTIPTDGRIDLDALAELAQRLRDANGWLAALDYPGVGTAMATCEDGANALDNIIDLARRTEEWEDISTAPTDGTHILVCFDGEVSRAKPPTVAHWFGAPWVPGLLTGGWYLSVQQREGPQIHPSHWMPVPPRRAAIPSEQGEAVAWDCADDDGIFCTTHVKTAAENIAAKGYTVTPLYAHPAPAAGVKVTDAMVEAACKANLHPLGEPSDTERRKMRASLEAALEPLQKPQQLPDLDQGEPK